MRAKFRVGERVTFTGENPEFLSAMGICEDAQGVIIKVDATDSHTGVTAYWVHVDNVRFGLHDVWFHEFALEPAESSKLAREAENGTVHD